MGLFRGTPASSGVRTLALALASVGLVAGIQLAQAATIGHARLVSGPGEPLRIVVPVHALPSPEAETLRVSIPPASDWAAAGLSPPVSLESLGFDVAPGFAPETRLITLRSSQPFSSPVVDLLIDVSSASGRQRHQVSLLAPAGASVTPPAIAASGGSTGTDALGRQIRVREGDNLFGIARRNAVPGVTVYQMMVGLYQQNPSAFIQKNLNLVRAGATLRVPDQATLTAISDREARRIFEQHARAFALYRNRLAATPDVIAAPTAEQAASGQVQSEPAVTPVPAPAPDASDRLRLSAAAAGSPGGQAGGATGNGGGNSSTLASAQSPAGADDVASQASAAASPGAASGGNGAANGSAGTSVTGSRQAASQPYPGAADDDRVAQQRALGDARSRVAELEDTVRELRDALADVIGAGSSDSSAVPPTASSPAGSADARAPASSGAPDAAREGVAGASAGIVDSVSSSAAVQPEAAAEAGQGEPAASAAASGASASAAASGAGALPVTPQASSAQASDTTVSAQASAGGSASPLANGQGAGAASRPENGQVSAGAPSGTSAEDAAAVSANGGTGATASGAHSAMAVSPDTASVAGATPAAGNGQSADAAGSTLASQQGTAAETSSSDAAPATSQQPAGASAGQDTETSNENRARQVAEPITEKAEKTVSWLQENLIAIGGGVLALIVLFVLWLVRRSGRPADDGENAITEAMIREKLEKIDLDLSSSSESGNSRER